MERPDALDPETLAQWRAWALDHPVSTGTEARQLPDECFHLVHEGPDGERALAIAVHTMEGERPWWATSYSFHRPDGGAVLTRDWTRRQQRWARDRLAEALRGAGIPGSDHADVRRNCVVLLRDVSDGELGYLVASHGPVRTEVPRKTAEHELPF